MSTVTIIDYGMGNLASVCRAFEHLGAQVTLSADPQQVREAERLVLPGVGAFGDGMQALENSGLGQSIHASVASGTPLLGICLGAQMLLDGSEEFGTHTGLGLIPGKVLAIPDTAQDGQALKVPHMGWADLQPANAEHFNNPLLHNITPGSAVYFVHSYQAHPQTTTHLAAVCDYAGHQLTAMLQHEQVYGCQFHPEKSGPVGLALLQNFLELAA